MAKKMKVAVLFGGPSSEREISMITGKVVCENLDKKKYDILPIEMGRDSKFYINKKGGKKTTFNITNLKENGIGIVFIAMHGAPGENGAVQGMLETLDIPYTGSGVLASAMAMNKVYTGEIYYANNLPSPQFINFKKYGWKNNLQVVLDDIKKNIGYPCVLKPVDQGSSVGVSIVKNETELIRTTNKIINKFPWLMVQKFVKGKEITCGVLEKDGLAFALPPTHIVANLGEFYDYDSKYKNSGSTHICPADLPESVNHNIKELAVRVHLALGCNGMSRTDIFYGEDEHFYIIETNTIPGMTPVSLLPESARVDGISFPKMLDLIIKAGLKR